ncbi:gluconokinase [Lactiplantibacillus fabifermentans]|uniref:Gluconate kinase n=2 Tax=Lactiplantibacillus fabifermentans TaxID=483011 RepID=A0A0R2NTZ9_9LACO|nr:gluconokinase [Lactiplantibacillus fabifermentans]ETY73661.1 gluconokinase [Lactiplantibacillus fabifermentans T30PCM01]KRO29160.1 gluconate kinase [Lactiplantibacillus fabifermentans DSM 21115]
MDYIIGIDVGTTSTKAVLYNTDGKIFGYENKLYPLIQTTPDTAEEDPDVIFKATIDALAGVSKKATNGRILGVAWSTQQHSLLGLDADFKPTTKVITWGDNRAEKVAAQMDADGRGLALYKRTGLPTHPMGPVYKLLWLRQAHPDIYQQTRYWVGLKEYLLYRYFGELKEDYSMASATGLFNIHTMDWDEESLKLTGITRDQLPELVDTTYQLKGLKPALATLTGLEPTTPFIIGATDGALSEIGLGAIDDGEVAVTIGTSGAVRTFVDEPRIDPKGRIYCYPVMAGKWIIGGPVNNGGIVFRWVRDNLCAPEKAVATELGIDEYDLLTQMAASVPAGSDGLLFHPFLGGERAPIWDGNARASYVGLTRKHTKAHMVRAALEGIVYNLYTVQLALQESIGMPKKIMAAGGFARSPLWRQLLADIFEEPVAIPEAFEVGCLGAMTIAQISLGLASDLSVVKKFIGETKVYQPDTTTFDNYRALVPIYMRLTGKLESEYKNIADYQREHQ